MARIHFHFRLGNDDIPAPVAPAGVEVVEVALIPNQHGLGHCIGTTIDELRELGVSPTEVGVDFLLLGSAVLTVDKNVSRLSNAEDSWTRELAVSLPVSNPALWAGVAPQITKALAFLTGDRWTLEFRARPEARAILARPPIPAATLGIDCISLLSGGLDSFIGAIDLLSGRNRVLFVSHSAVGTDSGRQRQLVNALKIQFPDNQPTHLRASIRFQSAHLDDREKEDTERSRSFLFYSIAALAATALPTVNRIVVPENGLISLNVPLEELRLGSLSTRTTHPFLVARMNEIFAAVGIRATLANPYQFKTKGEMVRECANHAFLAAELAGTISCSSPNNARIHYGTNQCGYCVPCIIRRASLLNNIIPDTTQYGIADLKAQSLPSDKKSGEHIRGFQAAILRLNNSRLRASIYVHECGPLSDHPKSYNEFAGVYLRGLQEVSSLLNGVNTRPHA
jgi:7-cyano-7-deazaguanine synthase in queuosine biosynthesis